MTHIPMDYVVWGVVIRLVFVSAFIFWSTRWSSGGYWQTRGDEITATIVVAVFIVVHFVFMPLHKLAGFTDQIIYGGDTSFAAYFWFDLVERFATLFTHPVPIFWCWAGLYLLVMFGLNWVVHHLRPLDGVIGKVVAVIVLGLVFTLGLWSIFILPFKI